MVRGKEQGAYLLFSNAIMAEQFIVIVRAGNPLGLHSPQDLTGKRLTTLSMSNTPEIKKMIQSLSDAKISYKNTIREMIHAVISNEADCAVFGRNILSIAQQMGVLNYIDLAFPIGNPFYTNIATRKDRPELNSIINKALQSFSPKTLTALQSRWIIPLNYKDQTGPAIALTAKEKQFLKDHPVIRAHNEQNWKPLNFYRDGQPQGYVIDLLNLLAEKLGIKIEYVSGPTWDEFIDMLKSREIDLIGNLVETKERQRFALFVRQPVNEDLPGLACRKDLPIKSIEALSGKTVAVAKGFWHEEVLHKYDPSIKLYQGKDTLDCLKAVSYGKADAAIDTGSVIHDLLLNHGITNLTITGDATLPGADTFYDRIGVRNDWPLLVNILEKACPPSPIRKNNG